MERISKFIINQKWLTANLLTSLRLCLFAPLLIFFSVKEQYLIALIFFILGAVTDLCDGYIARLKKTEKESGLIFDVISDKIFIFIPFIILGMKFLNQVLITIIVVLEVFHILLVMLGRIFSFSLKITGSFIHLIKMCLMGITVGFLLVNFFPQFLASFFLHLIIIASTLNIFIYLLRIYEMLAFRHNKK